jgi:hypothetical protein
LVIDPGEERPQRGGSEEEEMTDVQGEEATREARDGSQTQGGRSVLDRATERKRKRRYRDQPFGIRNKNKKQSLDSDTQRERLSG